jgi:anti-sigma B factor antagonist
VTHLAPTRPVEFSVTETVSPDAPTIISVVGEVDLLNAPRLGAALNRPLAEHRSVVVDLSGVTFLESSGLTSLLRASQVARSADLSFRLAVQLPHVVTRLFELANVDGIFAFEGTDG